MKIYFRLRTNDEIIPDTTISHEEQNEIKANLRTYVYMKITPWEDIREQSNTNSIVKYANIKR